MNLRRFERSVLFRIFRKREPPFSFPWKLLKFKKLDHSFNHFILSLNEWNLNVVNVFIRTLKIIVERHESPSCFQSKRTIQRGEGMAGLATPLFKCPLNKFYVTLYTQSCTQRVLLLCGGLFIHGRVHYWGSTIKFAKGLIETFLLHEDIL